MKRKQKTELKRLVPGQKPFRRRGTITPVTNVRVKWIKIRDDINHSADPVRAYFEAEGYIGHDKYVLYGYFPLGNGAWANNFVTQFANPTNTFQFELTYNNWIYYQYSDFFMKTNDTGFMTIMDDDEYFYPVTTVTPP